MEYLINMTVINKQQTNVPVLLNVFNRPEKTKQLINALRIVRPRQVFLAADGPRPDRNEDIDKCRSTCKELSKIDWPSEQKTLLRDQNLGCDLAVSGAISWFFEHIDYGLIFEDDCVPHPDLFRFAEEIFERFSEDKRIMQISGLSPYPTRQHPYDYHFGRKFRCWGWGTWKRAWSQYSDSVEVYADQIEAILRSYYPSQVLYIQRMKQYDAFHRGDRDNWDFKWNLACYANNGLAVVPENNLVVNNGFDEDSTHTKNKNHWLVGLKFEPLNFPLRHPPFVYADIEPEEGAEKTLFHSLNCNGRFVSRWRQIAGACHDLRKRLA